MYRDIEYRISKLERELYRHNRYDEFFDLLDNPSHDEEDKWVNNLFSKYTSLKEKLKNKTVSNSSDMFRVEMYTKNKLYKFCVYTRDDRDSTTLDVYKNGRLIKQVNNLHLYYDLNVIAKYMLEILATI